MKEAIIKTDGGICSQIGFCILGKYMEDLGYKVKYDISWFREYGKDVNGVFARDYSMDKAFPDLKFEIATPEEIKKAKHIYFDFYSSISSYSKLPDKIHISGYPRERGKILKNYKDYFAKNFRPNDIDSIKDILKEVENTNSCAVHIRRGDLSTFGYGYGGPPSLKYFLDSMEIINLRSKQNGEPVFYIFSDEPDWVKENILPHVKYNCKLIDKNDSSKGYLDLYIMSKCKNTIASQGSLGIYAKILNPDENMTLIMPEYRNQVLTSCSNVILYSDSPKIEDFDNTLADKLTKKLKKYKNYFKHTLILLIILILAFLTYIYITIS